MKYPFYYFFIVFLFLHLTSQQQEYFNKRIDHYYNKDKANNIIETSGGYVIGGYTYPEDPAYTYIIHLTFTGISDDGEINLFKEYGYDSINMFLGNPGSLIQYSDTNYISVGTKRIYPGEWVHDEGMLGFYDQSFDTLWTKLYGEKVQPYDTAFMLYQVKQTVQNTFIMTGLRMPNGIPSKIWLMETDSLGNKLWEQFYGDDEYYYQGHSVVQASDGGYMIGGYKFIIGNTGSGDPVIIKTDSVGKEEWTINPGNPDIDDNKVMLSLSDDGNVIAGTNYGTQQSGDNQWMLINIMKITHSGQVIWDYNYGEPGYDKFLLNTTVLNNGNIVTNGVLTPGEDNKPWELSWILCTDSLGNELWYREYALLNGESSFNDLFDVKQTSDNGLIGCGMVIPIVPDTGSTDIWVMKMDSLGCYQPGCDTTVDVIEYHNTLGSTFSIYPNPVSGEFTLEFESELTVNHTIVVYDMYGNAIKNESVPIGEQTLTLNASGWPPGLYMLSVMRDNVIYQSKKFVVK
jgi:type IX secretion system substrate protein